MSSNLIIDEETKQIQFLEVFQRFQRSFQHSLETQHVDHAWSVLGQAAEKFLHNRCSKFKGQFGRHRKPTIKTEFVASSGIQCNDSVNPCSRKLTLWTKALRKVSEITHKKRRFEADPDTFSDHDASHKIFASLQKIASSFHLSFSQHWTRCDLTELKDTLEQAIQQECELGRTTRLQAWKTKLKNSFEVYKHGGAAFAWLRNKPVAPIVAVRNAEGQIDTDPALVLQNIQNAWQTLFNKSSLVKFSDLEQQAAGLIAPCSCDLNPFTGIDLQERILKGKNTRATALDGWRLPAASAGIL